MIIKNISTKKPFTTKDGQEKVSWLPVGILKEAANGNLYIELNMFPGQTFYVFDQRERQPEKKDIPDVELDDAIPVEEVELA